MSEVRNISRARQYDRHTVASGGFTLVEMLLVLVIIAIVSSSVAVALSGRQGKNTLRVAATDLAAAISYASSQAKLDRFEYRVVFLDGARSFRVETLSPESQTEFAPARGLAGKEKQLPRDVRIVSISGSEGTLRELPDWLAFGSGGSSFTGIIELQSEGGRSTSIEVVGRTGQVIVTK